MWHYQFELSRRQEPFRDLQAQLHNMFAEKPLRAHELYELFADRYNQALQAAAVHKPRAAASGKETWARLQAMGLIPA